ncbi:hypothetical protein E2C01_080798 [Portunus trituberculatus]|uniref:Uncharacterized protein n=1 Tax=Portunus trituberculatus TaxID=210409 RepID=A0A5B7IUZ1_PORTR|nr:hypothetical protein [Portunus trituberculatus]
MHERSNFYFSPTNKSIARLPEKTTPSVSLWQLDSKQRAMCVSLQRVITPPFDPDEPFPDIEPPNAFPGT